MILALAQCLGDGKRRYTIEDFHPHLKRRPRGTPINDRTIDRLIDAWVGHR